MNFLLPCYFEKTWLLWLSMLEVLLFLRQYELLSWIFRIWIFISQLRRFTLKLCQSITPHQKFFFYHLPTRGRAGIKLGDAWYVSNVSIIFDCSMLLYLLFGTILGFIFYFYITSGTNLLTRGPAQNCCFFAYFRVLKKRNIKRSPNGMKPSGELFLERKQSRRLGVDVKKATRKAEAGGAPSTLVGPSWLPWPTSFAYICPYTLKTTRSRIDREFHRRKPL